MPAFWTRMSTRPKRASVASTRRSTDCLSATSVATNSASPRFAEPLGGRLAVLRERIGDRRPARLLRPGVPRSPRRCRAPRRSRSRPCLRPVPLMPHGSVQLARARSACSRSAICAGSPSLRLHRRRTGCDPHRARTGSAKTAGVPFSRRLHQLEARRGARQPRRGRARPAAPRRRPAGAPRRRRGHRGRLQAPASGRSQRARRLEASSSTNRRERRQKADDLLLADLAAAADAVLRQALEPRLVDEVRQAAPTARRTRRGRGSAARPP